MPPRFTVDKLPEEQFESLIKLITNGGTDRSIPRDFEKKFNVKLAPSSFSRWRKAVGNEIADRHRFGKALAKQVIEDLGMDDDADKFQVVMQSIEDRIITAGREIISQDPLKLLAIRQKEEDRRIRERELNLKERAQQFNEEQALKSEQLQHDRLRIGADTWQFILSYLLGKEPQAADLLTKHSEEILNGLEAHLDQTA
jgi:predicted DNA-binding protein YlxM (UPF0122 family)